ncbi:MAG: glycosyltransferase family 2 protein [Mycoplasmoidaceae bacterium]|nr:glycosyltransferase family 2 protein [Mycoplasmoidaceae bacterium]
MTKNTKANITLIFSIVRKSGELAKALEAISRQTDKNCHLIFVFNGCGASEKDIFKKFDFRGFEKVEYVFLSENLGDVYTYQYVERNNNLAKYHYLFDSNIVLMPNFVATLNKFVNEHPEADVVSFFGVPNTYFKDEYITINTLSDDFCHRPLTFFNNKLIRVGFLKENKIVQKKFKTYPTLFYIKVAMANPK